MSDKIVQRLIIAGVGLLLAFSSAHARTVRQCEDEWKANKTAIQASGQKKTEFMTACRAGAPTTTAQAAPTQTAPTQTEPSTSASAENPRTAPKSQSQARAGQATKAGEFATAAQAQSHCTGSTVVWANTKSSVYHFAGTRNYGNTKTGAYMCEADATAAGIRAAKNEKRPS
jgi:hypothetical protein